MEEHVYPNEARFHEEIEANRRAGDAWVPTRVVEELKQKAARTGCGTCGCRNRSTAPA